MTARHDETSLRPGARVGRRGLVAAAAAFVAGMVGKVSTATVEARESSPEPINVALGATNTTADVTTINKTGEDIALVLTTAGGAGYGLYSAAPAIGVFAESSNPSGVAGAGLYGQALSANSYGVWGTSTDGVAVMGHSVAGAGVRGEIHSTAATPAIAVYGVNVSGYAGPSSGAGGFGVYGYCANGHGLVGATGVLGGAGVVGATNGTPGAYAAVFYGPVAVAGDFTVLGGAKSAAVPHPDGSHRRLYCEEAPESWFADYGRAEVIEGRADVKIDPDFAATADLSTYHVFLTPYGNTNGLHVTNQTPAGFTVREHNGGTNCLGVSWRIVAKRKDIAAPRLEKVVVPAEPTLPAVATAVQPPTRPHVTR